MQVNAGRAIITLLWAGSIIVAGPAIGYAESASEYARFGSTASNPDYAGLAFAAPSSSIAVQQDDNDNEDVDNDNVAENDNSFDDDQDTADNENGNDNFGDFADEAELLRAAVSDSATEIEAGRLDVDVD